jgi:hypothetical protein
LGKIKRKLLASFLNTGTVAVPVWSLIGDGVTSMSVAYNPQTSDETYIHEDSGTVDVESYKPNSAVPMTAMQDDPVFAFVDNLRKNRAVLDDARTEICQVYLYETPSGGAYEAEKNTCSIQIDDFGGDGGASAVINFTINFIGDPVVGTFNPISKTFTASVDPTQLVTFSVTGTASARLSGAQIVINSKILTTDENGIANIQLPAGTYSYTVTMTDYTTISDSVTVTSAAVFEEVSMVAS